MNIHKEGITMKLKTCSLLVDHMPYKRIKIEGIKCHNCSITQLLTLQKIDARNYTKQAKKQLKKVDERDGNEEARK